MYINLLRGAFLLSSNTLFLLMYWLSKLYILSNFGSLKTRKSGTNAVYVQYVRIAYIYGLYLPRFSAKGITILPKP